MNQLQPQASRQSKTSFPFNWPVTSNVRLCSRRYFGKKECYRSSVGSTHFTDEETEAQREETPYPTKVTVQSNGLESSPRLLGWISLLPLESIPVLIKADFPPLPSSPTPHPITPWPSHPSRQVPATSVHLYPVCLGGCVGGASRVSSHAHHPDLSPPI